MLSSQMRKISWIWSGQEDFILLPAFHLIKFIPKMKGDQFYIPAKFDDRSVSVAYLCFAIIFLRSMNAATMITARATVADTPIPAPIAKELSPFCSWWSSMSTKPAITNQMLECRYEKALYGSSIGHHNMNFFHRSMWVSVKAEKSTSHEQGDLYTQTLRKCAVKMQSLP